MSASSAEALPQVFPTVVHMLADTCARFPQATALACGRRRLAYCEYLRCVAGFADELIRHGARGSRVALVCANSLDMPIAMFGAHAAGAQAVPINPTYTERELSYILGDADPVAIVYDDDIAGKVEPLIAAIGIRHAVRLGGAFQYHVRGGIDRFADLEQPFHGGAQIAVLEQRPGVSLLDSRQQ